MMVDGIIVDDMMVDGIMWFDAIMVGGSMAVGMMTVWHVVLG